MSAMQDDEMSMRDVLEILFLRKNTIIRVFAGVVLTAAFLCFYLISPIYESSAKVLINMDNLVVPATRDAPVSDVEKLSSFNTQKEMITSGILAHRVVEQLHLDQTHVLSRLERINVWIRVSVKRPLGKLLGIGSWVQPINYQALAERAIAAELKVESKADSQIITVVYRAYSPDEAASTLNAVLAAYRDDFSARAREQAEGMTNYLEAQLDDVQTKLSQSEDKLLSLRKSDTVQLSRTSSKRVDNPDADALSSSGSILGASDNEIVQNQLKTSILSMQEQLRTLLTQYTDHDPAVVTLRAQIQHLSEALTSVPQRELSSLRLKRDLEVNQDAYLFLRKNLEHQRILAASNVGQINIINIVDPATANRQASSPKTSLVMIVAVLFGLAFGVVLAWIQNLSDHTVHNENDLQRHLGLRVIASLPEL